MKRLCVWFIGFLITVSWGQRVLAQETAKPKPLKALLITGGCCHDYGKQKEILKRGIESRAMVEVTQVHTKDSSVKARFDLYDNPDWAKGYDVILHDECTADVVELPYVDNILNAHKNGVPAVNLHCAMHSYRLVDRDDWFQFVGIQSSAHGPQEPIDVTFVDRNHPVTKSLENWTTIREELYNNVKLFPTARPLARGRQDVGNRIDDAVVVWTSEFGKGRVFSTTLGHNSETVSDPRYLDLVTRGLLWACNKLDPEYLQPFAVAKKERVPVNLARGKTATASASQQGHPPEHAIDGNPDTRWCSPNNDTGYSWQVDLGQPEELTGCQIVWEQDGVNYRFQVEGSVDGKAWSMLSDQSKTDDRDQVQQLKFSVGGVRHVRLTTTQLTPGCWGSFFEFEVHGTKTEERTIAGDNTLRPRVVKGLPGVKVPAGFAATLFAGPPDVNYPTCVATTPDGVVFVGVDENGSLDKSANRGRIVRCRDLDGDGKADEFKDFAKMDSPRGIVVIPQPPLAADKTANPQKVSLIVLHPPTLSAFHDDDGDGISDRSEVLVNGIGFDLKTRPADHTTNGIQVGIDGWIYVAVGDYGFVNAVGSDGQSASLRGGGIARVRPDGSELEIVSRGQRNIYDVAISPTMDLFTRDNTNDGGGWNVRLSHVPQNAQMGYPSLFINFPEEIVQPMADYGGGSPCGSLFVDEPTLPGELSHQLLTCDWGRSIVYRHPLTPKGAGFTAEQEPLIEVPRPTDIDVDASGNLYIASWKDGSFTFSGPNVGYVLKVKPPSPIQSSLTEANRNGTVVGSGDASLATPPTAAELIRQMASSSHTVRLHAQRQILRQGDHLELAQGLEKLAATADAGLPVRVAAIFTLKQLRGEKSHPALLALSQDPLIRESTIRAMADRKSQLVVTDIEPIVADLTDPNPRVRLAAARALGRFTSTATTAARLQQANRKLVQRTADQDPLVVQIAIQSLVELKAIDACLEALSSPSLDQRLGALMVLRQIDDSVNVNGLLARLNVAPKTTGVATSDEIRLEAQTRQAILTTLCRLYFREKAWNGDWWGTRPDTSGPFYQPVVWSESVRILKALSATLLTADADTSKKLLAQLKRHKIELPDTQPLIVKLAAEDRGFLPTAIDLLSSISSPLSESSGQLLERVATASEPGDELRAKALRSLYRRLDQPTIAPMAIRSFLRVDEQAQQGEVGRVWEEWIRESKLGNHLATLISFANRQGDVPGEVAAVAQENAYAVLNGIADNLKVGKDERVEALSAVETAWKTPAATVSLLRAIGRSRAESQSLQVRALRTSENPVIRSAAEFAARKMELDQEPAFDPSQPLIATLGFEETLKQAVNTPGDAKLGARLFTRQGCAACHTVSPTEPLKGPLLQDITKRYQKAELIESIVKPSAKIAQGFESQYFVTNDGKILEGFVVRESGEEIEFRNVAGLAAVLKKTEIEDRGKRATPIMPSGLVDKLNPGQLASILSYLESLKK